MNFKSLVKNVRRTKVFRGFDNFEDNDRYLTHYIKIRGYYRDLKHSCVYHRFHFSPSLTREVETEDRGCKLNFINCGQGDACLIENKGKYALIDFGGKPDSVKNFLDCGVGENS